MHQWHLFYFLGHSNSAERKSEDTHKSVQMLLLMQVMGSRSSGEILALSKSRTKLPTTAKAPTDANGLQEAAAPRLALRYAYTC